MYILEPDDIINCTVNGYQFTIKKKIVPADFKAPKDVCSYVKKGDSIKPCRLMGKMGERRVPLGITIHNTNEVKTSSTQCETYVRATYNGNMSGVIPHFYVYGSEIWQILECGEQGWHAADGDTLSGSYQRKKSHFRDIYLGGNMDTIAIEVIGNHADSEFTAQLLAAWLCYQYDLKPRWDIYTHNFWMYGADKMFVGVRKNCPCYILPHWVEFIEGVEKVYTPDEKIFESQEVKRILDEVSRIHVFTGDIVKVIKKLEEKGY